MVRDTDLAWAAGIVDGEGCILIYEAHTKTGDTWVLRLIVTNTDMRMLDRLRVIFNCGNIAIQRRRDSRHKTAWRWEVSAKKAEQVLSLIKPYLVNKRDQAEVGLLSRSLMMRHGYNAENPNAEQIGWLKKQLSDLKRVP